MKRIMVTQIGEPKESLVVQEVEAPKPKAGEVLVEMLAIPIHPADLLVMRGRHVFNATYPCGTGIEGAGRVIAHGPGVNHPSIGQRVALPFGGTWRSWSRSHRNPLFLARRLTPPGPWWHLTLSPPWGF